MNGNRDNGRDCRQIRRDLLECFDGNALEHLPNSLNVHLASCQSCRKEFERLQALTERLSNVPVLDPGDNYRINLLPSVRFQLDQRRARRPKKDLVWAPAMALAIMLALALVREPAHIAPPSWYQSQTATTRESGSLAQTDNERLSQALERRDSLALGLTGSEMDLILTLSDSTTMTLDDPVEQLVTMSDEAVEAILNKVGTSSIRS